MFLLAALLHEIDARGGFDARASPRTARTSTSCAAFVAALLAPTRSRRSSGIAAGDDPRAWRATFATAPAASVHMSTGVNMGRQGTLAYWLVHMLCFVTGNLDREGGNLKSDGFYPNAKAGRRRVRRRATSTREFGRLRRGVAARQPARRRTSSTPSSR